MARETSTAEKLASVTETIKMCVYGLSLEESFQELVSTDCVMFGNQDLIPRMLSG